MAKIEEDIECLKPIIRGRTRFFVIKSFNHESLKVSIENEVWATTAGPTKKLTNAFKNVD